MTITLKGIPHRLVAFLTLYLFHSASSSVPYPLYPSLLSISCSCSLVILPLPRPLPCCVSHLVLAFLEHFYLALFSPLSLSFLPSHFFFQPVPSLPDSYPPFSLSLSLVIYVYVYMYIYVCIYVCMYVCICVSYSLVRE